MIYYSTPPIACTAVQQYRICNVQPTTQDIDALLKQYNTTLHNITLQQAKTAPTKAKPSKTGKTNHIFSLLIKVLTLA